MVGKKSVVPRNIFWKSLYISQCLLLVKILDVQNFRELVRKPIPEVQPTPSSVELRLRQTWFYLLMSWSSSCISAAGLCGNTVRTLVPRNEHWKGSQSNRVLNPALPLPQCECKFLQDWMTQEGQSICLDCQKFHLVRSFFESRGLFVSTLRSQLRLVGTRV